MVIGRVLSGFSTRMVYPAAPVYPSELPPPENRGFLVSIKGVLITFGILCVGLDRLCRVHREGVPRNSVSAQAGVGKAEEYIRRTLLGCLRIKTTKLSGSNVLQTYQSMLYDVLGCEGRTFLLITALYGFMAVIAQIISIFTIIDHWSRKEIIFLWLQHANRLSHPCSRAVSSLLFLLQLHRLGHRIRDLPAGAAWRWCWFFRLLTSR